MKETKLKVGDLEVNCDVLVRYNSGLENYEILNVNNIDLNNVTDIQIHKQGAYLLDRLIKVNKDLNSGIPYAEADGNYAEYKYGFLIRSGDVPSDNLKSFDLAYHISTLKSDEENAESALRAIRRNLYATYAAFGQLKHQA